MTARSRIAVGSYTHATAVGIRVIDLDDDGMRERTRIEGVAHASFLVHHPTLPVLYSVSETVASSDGVAGAVVALRFDEEWQKQPVELGRVPSRGDAPCHLAIDRQNEHLYVANYVSGTVACWQLESDGSLGALLGERQHEGSGPTDRQREPHAHCVRVDLESQRIHAVDLGADRVFSYDLAGLGSELQPVCEWEAAPGAGPRHLALHPSAPVAFVVGELDSTVTMLRRDTATGGWVTAGVWPTLPGEWSGASTTAEVAVHPTGKYVYVSNRGHDSLAVFEFVDERAGLAPRGWVESGGAEPRHFALNHDGSVLVIANQASNSLVRMSVDQATGQPRILDRLEDIDAPVCVLFLDEAR